MMAISPFLRKQEITGGVRPAIGSQRTNEGSLSLNHEKNKRRHANLPGEGMKAHVS
jgi:hypothetical protein